MDVTAASFQATREHAQQLDAQDALREFRTRFEIPAGPDGRPATYMCGNSLGLMPRAARTLLQEELDDWSRLAVEAHHKGHRPWVDYHEQFREIGARLVGATPGEVVMMNSLTVNLHLMMVSFYRPAATRTRVIMERGAFPSDTYAIRSHVATRGLDPAQHVIEIGPRPGEALLRTEDILDAIARTGDELALVLLGGVNYATGQALDIPTITAAAHKAGATCGWDLAHWAGNLPAQLHAWNVDFACWCSYKYLNSGPGAVAGCFVHERHGSNFSLPRYAGWWGNDPATRFRMGPDFVPRAGADGWQCSNPPIMAMAPLLASLRIFDEAGMDALRAKSRALTGYLWFLLRDWLPHGATILTPADPGARGCQLSIAFDRNARERHAQLGAAGVMCDFREPNIIRLAPVPLYNSFENVFDAATALCVTPVADRPA
ncbi:MAG: kynureninase [Phycisphaerales bacterium]